jgi:hypothetical protein
LESFAADFSTVASGLGVRENRITASIVEPTSGKMVEGFRA